MRPTLLAAMTIAVALSTGCIDVDQKLVLNADGSGTLDVKYNVPEETVSRVRGMMALSEQLSGVAEAGLPPVPDDEYVKLVFDPDEAALRKKLDSYKPYGIRTDELKVQTVGAVRRVYIKVSFADISKVAKADFFKDYGFSLVKSEKNNYVLYTRSPSQVNLDPGWDFSKPEVSRSLTPMMAGFRFNVNVKLPGRILKTNAHRQPSPVMAEWTYDFNADPNAVVRLQKEQFSAIFESAGVMIPQFRQNGQAVTTPVPAR